MDDLRRGDLLFLRSRGRVQRLADLAGDTFRHCGIVDFIDGRAWLLEAGLNGHRARPMATILATYDEVQINRSSPCEVECGNTVVGRAHELTETPVEYFSTPDLGLVGMISLARHYASDTSRLAGWARAFAACRLDRAGPGRERSICAGFVAEALQAACPDHRPHIDLRQPKTTPPAEPTGHLVDLRYAMPDDIWRGLPHAEHYVLAS